VLMMHALRIVVLLLALSVYSAGDTTAEVSVPGAVTGEKLDPFVTRVCTEDQDSSSRVLRVLKRPASLVAVGCVVTFRINSTGSGAGSAGSGSSSSREPPRRSAREVRALCGPLDTTLAAQSWSVRPTHCVICNAPPSSRFQKALELDPRGNSKAYWVRSAPRFHISAHLPPPGTGHRAHLPRAPVT